MSNPVLINNGNDYRKRKRISLTCTNCKSRKIKCDRGSPCSACKKNFVPDHLCIYKDSPFVPTFETVGPEDRLLVLKRENQKLKEELELLRVGKPGFQLPRNTSTPIPLANRELINCEAVSLKPDRIVYFGPTCWRNTAQKHKEGQEVIQKLMSHVSNSRREWKIRLNLKNIPYEEYVDTETAFPDQLLRNLAGYLPQYDLIQEYLNTYIDSFWAYNLPVVDSNTLKKDFQTLFLKDETTGKCHIITKSKSIDYAKIALIITVFKIVVTIVNNTIQSVNFDQRDRLHRYSRKLLQFARMDIKATLPALQTLILQYQLKRVDPLDGDGGDASNGAMLLKSAISMAIVMGLNRNIDTLYAMETSAVRGTLKKIWRFLYLQDGYLSLFLGIPLTVDDDSICEETISDGTLRMRLAHQIRQASKIFTRNSGATTGEVYTMIKQLEAFDDGCIGKTSESIKLLSGADEMLTRYDVVSSVVDRIMGIYTLHTLWETLNDGLDDNDPFKVVCTTAAMKYSVMGITHFIELLYRFNRMCHLVSESGDMLKLYKIVDTISAIIGISKIIFIRAYMTLFSNELRTESNDRVVDLHAKLGLAQGEQTFKLHIKTVEELDPMDESSLLVKLLRSPAFSQGLMALACKHLLQLQNRSFARLFSFNFCLYGIVTCYKFYDSFVERHIPSDKFSQRRMIQALVSYAKENSPAVCPVDNTSVCGPPEEQNSISDPLLPRRSPASNPLHMMGMDIPSLSGISATDSSSPLSPMRAGDSATTESTSIPSALNTPIPSDTPAMGSTSFYNGDQDFNFDFFDFKDHAVDRLFNSILMDDQYLTTFDQQMGFLNNLGGM